jgi:catechol 2,3-dioxygenase-like lactoylglutathione lyase family enzyme
MNAYATDGGVLVIQGVSHITFSVRDLEASFAFYTKVLGLRPVARWYKGAYLEAGDDWICLSLDADVRPASLPEYTHTAFTVSREDFSVLEERIRSANAICWQENRSPGDSFYFLDPDGHKLEIHVSTLDDRIRAMKANPPRDLILFADAGT